MDAGIPCVATDISHAYSGKPTPALSHVSFALEPGRITGLVGANGSGKSTLLRILAGVQRPTSGRVVQFGADLASAEAAVPGVGAAVDGMSLWPTWTVRRTLQYAAALAGVSPSRIGPAMRDVQIEAAARTRVRTLSLGNRQRVSLAVATLTGTRLVLLDEPMNGLDPNARQDTRDLIIRLAAEGRTVLLSSHDLHDVETLSSSLIVLGAGVLAYHGPTVDFRIATTMTVLTIVGDATEAQGLLAGAGLHCRREPGGELVVFSHDAPTASTLLQQAKIPVREAAARPATLEERFHGTF